MRVLATAALLSCGSAFADTALQSGFGATITLNGVARVGGFPVALRTTNPAARPQAIVSS